jgi:DNA-binding response OmpR family regulator
MTTPKARIAIIDDEPAFIQLCEAVLTPEGYECFWSMPEVAVEQVSASMPDVVLLDLRLGDGVSGVDILQRLSCVGSRTEKIPVIVCTASTDLIHQNRELIEGLGCETVEKPFNIEDLLGAIERCLDRTPALAE